MRVILTARQTLTPGHAATLQRLVNILGVTAKNPSNPNFDQYLFESIAALIRWVFHMKYTGKETQATRRFVVAGSPNTLPGFEQALFGPFTFIIQQEVERKSACYDDIAHHS
jgi:exportin-2 (importin alpha re-exporter)